ncbi:MAG: MerR family transcriptional regulator, partial [Lachnospiraceae bacterium]|nr:MerR family transcriptional regulator [Lachnospiraceae bacterium]
MLKVKDVSNLTGVSVRTLHYYDKIGLLKPSDVTEGGYRLYDDTALERLQQIMLFRELQFPLNDIKKILDDKNFDRNKALEQQIELLTLRKEHLENLIVFARGIKLTGVKNMDFTAFDVSKIDEYTRQAKEAWGNTDAYKEYEYKIAKQSKEEQQRILQGLIDIFIEFGNMMHRSPESDEVQQQVNKLQEYITDNFYNCT